MNKLIVILLVMFVPIFSYSQNKFDVKAILGFDLTMNKKQVLKYLDDNNIKYSLVNNIHGGKFYEIDNPLNMKIDTFPIVNVKFSFKKNKIIDIRLESDWKMSGAFNDYLDNLMKFKANKVVSGDDSYFLDFDNVLLFYPHYNNECILNVSTPI